MPFSSHPASPSAAVEGQDFIAPSVLFRTAEWAELSRAVEARRQWIEQRHLELTAIPAPTFHEAVRAEWMAEQFRSLGLKQARIDEVGNVLADRPGSNRSRIWVTAHLDTVFPTGTAIQPKRDGSRIHAPGITDNGAGLAALLTIAAVMQECSLRTGCGIRFAANVGEEGEGDLRGMRHLFATSDARRNAAGVIVLDGAGVEHITSTGLGSRRFLVEVRGVGGHSWNDFGRANPIHALAAIIARIEQMPLSLEPRSTMSVGLIEGGSTVNSIPQSAWMKVDIRSTAMVQIERLTAALYQAVSEAAAQEMDRGSGGLETRLVQLGERPAADAQRPSRLVETFQQTDLELGIQSQLRCSSTDANWPLSLGIDAVSVGGGGSGGGVHTLEEWFDPKGRELGIKRVLIALLALAGVQISK